MTLTEYIGMLANFALENPELKNKEVYYKIDEPIHSYKLDTEILFPIQAELNIQNLHDDEIVVINS